MNETSNNQFSWVRPLAWVGAATLILLPLFALKIADQNAWETEDLPFAFIMVATIGVTFEFASRITPRWAYSAGVALGIATALLLTMGNFAVGFAGSENNQINVLFFAGPVIALVGGMAVRFRTSPLAIVLAGSAGAQILVGIMAFYQGYFTGPLTVTFASLWLASSLLFFRSSHAGTVAQ